MSEPVVNHIEVHQYMAVYNMYELHLHACNINNIYHICHPAVISWAHWNGCTMFRIQSHAWVLHTDFIGIYSKMTFNAKTCLGVRFFFRASTRTCHRPFCFLRFRHWLNLKDRLGSKRGDQNGWWEIWRGWHRAWQVKHFVISIPGVMWWLNYLTNPAPLTVFFSCHESSVAQWPSKVLEPSASLELFTSSWCQ